jgi:chemotaxis signal transduction protein
MKYLITRIDGKNYSIDAAHILEVVPLIHLHDGQKDTPSLAGEMEYRGKTIPVFDLSVILKNRPHQKKFSTRIVLLRLQDEVCGLICEGVTDLAADNSTAEHLDLNELSKL